MNTEEKAKRYDEAIEALRSLFAEQAIKHCDRVNIKDITNIFPELKESEDERIRKDMIETIKKEAHDFPASVIAEKSNSWLSWLERQGEQKPTDKIEVKFKIGDWVVVNDGRIGRIIECTKDFADVDLEFSCLSTSTNNIRSWTIQDAKDGDVLSFNDGYGNDSIELIKSITDQKIELWFCLTNSNYYEVFDGIVPYTNLASREGATPATKEQRDLLFSKMKEAGYEWDAEKKELKKIEQKPAWSEEDEKILNSLIRSLARIGASTRTDSTSINYTFSKEIDWLKSLRPQNKWISVDEEVYVKEPVLAQKKDKSDLFDGFVVCCDHTLTPNVYERYMILGNIVSQNTWKPSDEQLRTLELAIDYWKPEDYKTTGILYRLWEQLKKLREE